MMLVLVLVALLVALLLVLVLVRVLVLVHHFPVWHPATAGKLSYGRRRVQVEPAIPATAGK